MITLSCPYTPLDVCLLIHGQLDDNVELRQVKASMLDNRDGKLNPG
jgi:hypothetical protein